ncbi:MAG: dynamin family protein [Chthoniobacterales bacterium]
MEFAFRTAENCLTTGAAYAVWQNGEVALRRAPYDIEETVRALAGTPLDSTDVAALAHVLRTGGELPLKKARGDRFVNAVKPEVDSSLSYRALTGSKSAPLRSYNRVKSAIAARLRDVLEVLKKGGSESSSIRCEALMKKLAEDRFTLGVVGQFGRGKSSLMNAIIGRELLPVGSKPLTSAITILKFGPKERLIVRYKGRRLPEILPVSALANYITEPGNPGNHRKVATATVEVPLPFLRPGLEFVDTPGIGSEIEANTATPRSWTLSSFIPDLLWPDMS